MSAALWRCGDGFGCTVSGEPLPALRIRGNRRTGGFFWMGIAPRQALAIRRCVVRIYR